MVKVVQAAGYELSKARTRILELEEQNTKLKLDILELESRLAKYEPLGSSSTSLVQVSRNKTVTKRYQQATVASQNRSATPEKHPIPPSSESTVVISGTKYTYDNGVLVTRRPTSSGWYEDVYRYQQNTVSTWKKKKRQLKRPKSSDEVLEDDNGLDRGGDTMAASDSDWSVPMPAQEVDWNDPKFYRGPSEYEPPLHIRALKKRSGLHESGWLNTRAGKVFIPSRIGFKLLSRALRLAQESFYIAARENWPCVFQGNFIHGPHEVLFGYKELEERLGKSDLRMYLAIGGCSATLIGSALFGIVNLRNALCHFGRRYWDELRVYDDLLAKSQNLLVRLQDEKRAFKVRKLRDELRVEADKALQEVEALGYLAVLPYSLPPKPYHHGQLFRELEYRNKGDIYQYLACC